jgi:hypothetical protein
MTEDTDYVEGRRQCKRPDCEGNVEANPKLYLSAWADGTWTVDGVGDESVNIACDAEEHENYDDLLHKGLSAFLETLLPGTTWQGSDPQHLLGTDTVQVQMSLADFREFGSLMPDMLSRSTVIYGGKIQEVGV